MKKAIYIILFTVLFIPTFSFAETDELKSREKQEIEAIKNKYKK